MFYIEQFSLDKYYNEPKHIATDVSDNYRLSFR